MATNTEFCNMKSIRNVKFILFTFFHSNVSTQMTQLIKPHM